MWTQNTSDPLLNDNARMHAHFAQSRGCSPATPAAHHFLQTCVSVSQRLLTRTMAVGTSGGDRQHSTLGMGVNLHTRPLQAASSGRTGSRRDYFDNWSVPMPD